jgi:hypothetical protein
MKQQRRWFTYLLWLLVAIALIEVAPVIVTVLAPQLCYGDTYLGRLHQQLNASISLNRLNWVAFLIVCLYAGFHQNNLLHMVLALLVLYVAVYPITNVIDMVLELTVSNPPILRDYFSFFKESKEVEARRDAIIQEFRAYYKTHQVQCVRASNPGLKIEHVVDGGDGCWRTLNLKKGGKVFRELAPEFPETFKAIESPNIVTAFFSILDPGVEIPPHTGYYKGFLRYHLGVEVPTNDEGGETAYIVVGNDKYHWKQGEGILFDDMYLHYVKNPTHRQRVVLYLDVKRKLENPVLNALNNVGLYLIENSVLLQTFIRNQHQQKKTSGDSH